MPGFELGEKVADGARFACSGVFQALADAFGGVGLGSDVEQVLVRLCVLNHDNGFSLNGEHHRTLTFLELLHEIAGTAAEGGEGLNVSGNVHRRHRSIEAPC